MNDSAIEVYSIWKKFHRGELHDSLRDFLPSITRHFMKHKLPQNHLRKGDFWALQDINFNVKRGEALGIIGPNGAGKSTILKILSRILRPDRGNIRIQGRLSALIEISSGFHPDLTGRENIYLNGAILGMKKNEVDRNFKEIVDFSGVESFIDTPVKRYSSGMLARLGFSVMAYINPEILLVDEVLSVGDAAFRSKCIQRMSELLQSTNVSVIFISHHLDQIKQLCDRCLVLEQGKVCFLGEVEQACEKYFEILRHQSSKETEQGEDAAGSPGRLLGLTIFDNYNKASFKVPAQKPITFEIAYVLDRDLSRVGLGFNLHKANGQFVANCNTVLDEQWLPSSAGEHKVTLSLEDLPFYGGDYLIGIRLLDVDRAITLDLHDCRYPLIIEGVSSNDQTVYLTHKWNF